MKTLREKIEGLERIGRNHWAAPLTVMDEGKYLRRDDVLRIIAEHEQALSGAVVVPVLPTNEDDDRLMNEILGRVHEQRTGRVLLDLTPGGPVKTAPPVGQAGEKHRRLSDFRAADHECGADGQLCLYPVQIPVELIRMHAVWESATGLLVHAIDLCDPRYAGRCFRPWKSSWSDVEQMARDADGGANSLINP